jgi:hypothetical protein
MMMSAWQQIAKCPFHDLFSFLEARAMADDPET